VGFSGPDAVLLRRWVNDTITYGMRQYDFAWIFPQAKKSPLRERAFVLRLTR
jgi:hypothetical protein